MLTLITRFNPRVRAGRDDPERLCIAGQIGFNPRVRAGRDIRRYQFIATTTSFQSTRPRGTRCADRATSPSLILFQSTRPRGTRSTDSWSIVLYEPVSIHASARDAIKLSRIIDILLMCFNPRVRAGRDVPCGKVFRSYLLFQSTRPRGTRL